MKMEMNDAFITITANINASIDKVWNGWSQPRHIVKWNNASPDWHTPHAENNFAEGGKFMYRMEAKDASMGFNFSGMFDVIKNNELVTYTLDDGRKVRIFFAENNGQTVVTQTFEPEQVNTLELQKQGWQAILDSFKKYVESNVVLHFEVSINADSSKVFNTIIDKQLFSQWTASFNPTSFFEGTWEKGSKMLFIGINSEGKREGMVSRIRENIANKYLSVEHLGILKDGNEITSGSEVESWSGGQENYILNEKNGVTVLQIEMDSIAEYKDYFENTWPLALQNLKQICESI